ncbi:MAG: hypothetical protein P1U86_20610 [Verrucomicrobiales bacterium]|nr:hypothetical protein [Verrucomicrobiales bacterium]
MKLKSSYLLQAVVLQVVALNAFALDYEDDIMPVLVKKCADCHSNESGKAKGGFKVDDPKHLLGRLSKNNLVVPGDWDASYLFITLYRPEGHEDAMPPEGKGERLTEKEVKLVQDWITEGAPILGERGEKGDMPASTEPEKKEETMAESPKPENWTNQAGKTIVATLLKVDGDVALLRMANGKVYKVPVASLSAESQAKLKE